MEKDPLRVQEVKVVEYNLGEENALMMMERLEIPMRRNEVMTWYTRVEDQVTFRLAST